MFRKLLLAHATAIMLCVGYASNYYNGYTAEANGYVWHYYDCSGGVCIDGEDVGGDVCIYISAFADGERPSGSVTVPSYLGGKLVVEIGSHAFYKCTKITSITIPGSVRCIYDLVGLSDKLESITVNAFNSYYASQDGVLYNKSLTKVGIVPPTKTSISLPATVSNVDNLYGSNLSSITVDSQNPNFSSVDGVLYDKNITTIVKFPSQKTSVIIPGSVKTIGTVCDRAYTRNDDDEWWGKSPFICNENIKNITCLEGVEVIAKDAFRGCISLQSVILPSTIIKVGERAFTGCSSLSSVESPIFPESAYSGDYKKYDASWENYVRYTTPTVNPTIPVATTRILESAFAGNKMSTIALPNVLGEIGRSAFRGCSGLDEITIPPTVSNIASSAFAGCTGITKVNISDLDAWSRIKFADAAANPLLNSHRLYINGSEITTVSMPSDINEVGDYVFAGWSALKTVVLTANVNIIGAGAFQGCSGFSNIGIPPSVTSIGTSAFGGCAGLSRVDISDMAKWYEITFGDETANPLYYGHRLYCNGSEMTELSVPSNLSKINAYAFSGATNIVSVAIPQSVTSVEISAFKGCTSLKRVNISDLAKWCTVAFANESANPLYCGNHLFLNGSEITSLDIPSGVQAIGNYAFVNATALNSVKMPASVESVGTDAFKGCTGLTRVTIEDLSKWCAAVFANGDANPLSVAQHLYLNSDEITELVIPSGVSSIGQYAFLNASHISSVKIPAEVTTIGSGAFSGCSGVRSADVPAQFNLGNLFPAAKTSMERLTIPDGTTDIAANAYAGFGNIKEVVIPASVTNVGSKAFTDCTQLIRVDITDLTKWCAIHFADSEATPLVHNGSLFMDGDAVEHLVIPDEVTSISDYAFNNVTGIVSVTALSNVVDIGASAFVGCSGIRQVEIPANFILSSVFPDAYAAVTGIVISAGTEYIVSNAYQGCVAVDKIVIPSSVTNIGEAAFDGCTGLTRVDISDLTRWCGIAFGNATANPLTYGHHLYLNGSEITALNVPAGVSAISDYSFYNASAISAVTIPASVTSIGANAFTGCTGIRTIDIPASYNVATVFPSAYSAITQLTIPEGTTSIAANAYQGCSSVTAVVVPASVTTVGSGAFQDCSKLKSVTFKGQAPACGDNVFTGTSADMVVYAGTGTSGWTQWNGRPLAFVDPGSGSGSGSETVEKAQLTVTNVVIHYVVNSVVPEKTYPATYDTGFVNIITEVKSGGAVSVPATWMVNYPDYVTKFGADFTKSLMKTTGKYDGAGNPMCVWQDYVAGTDPTDPDDKFTASVTVDKDGKITVSYSPEFKDANEKALRVYTTYGKKSLMEKDWVVVPTGSEADYNFFKVTVEMK